MAVGPDVALSALLKVQDDIPLSVNAGNPPLLVLLDLTAAFDTVHPAVFVSYQKHHVVMCSLMVLPNQQGLCCNDQGPLLSTCISPL